MESFFDTVITIGLYLIVILGLGVAFLLFLALPARWIRRSRKERLRDDSSNEPSEAFEHKYESPPPPFPS